MDIKSFYRTQRELANILNQLIDKYWDDEVNENELIQLINNININNPGKIKKYDQYTSIVQQICGKRRLEVIDRILNMKDKSSYWFIVLLQYSIQRLDK